jgi:hypothetical protein
MELLNGYRCHFLPLNCLYESLINFRTLLRPHARSSAKAKHKILPFRQRKKIPWHPMISALPPLPYQHSQHPALSRIRALALPHAFFTSLLKLTFPRSPVLPLPSPSLEFRTWQVNRHRTWATRRHLRLSDVDIFTGKTCKTPDAHTTSLFACHRATLGQTPITVA